MRISTSLRTRVRRLEERRTQAEAALGRSEQLRQALDRWRRMSSQEREADRHRRLSAPDEPAGTAAEKLQRARRRAAAAR